MMKTTHKIGLLFGISGIILICINYIIHQYLFIFIGIIMIFVGVIIPIFFDDKKESREHSNNQRLSKQ